MKQSAILVGVAAALTVGAGLALPASAASDDDAVLHFADMNGIKNWQPDEAANTDAILVESRNGEWFRATFQGPCPELRFAHGVAFVTDALGNLDRFTSIIVEGRRCFFKTFERTSDPDERSGSIDAD